MTASSRVLPTFEPPNNASMVSAAVPVFAASGLPQLPYGQKAASWWLPRMSSVGRLSAAPSQHAITPGPYVAVQGAATRASVRRVGDVPVALSTRYPDAPDPKQGAVGDPEQQDEHDAEAGKEHHEYGLGQCDHAEEEPAGQRARRQPDEQQHPEQTRAEILGRP